MSAELSLYEAQQRASADAMIRECRTDAAEVNAATHVVSEPRANRRYMYGTLAKCREFVDSCGSSYADRLITIPFTAEDKLDECKRLYGCTLAHARLIGVHLRAIERNTCAAVLGIPPR